GEGPSALRLILPESRLEGDHVAEDIKKIQTTMAQYLEEETLLETKEQFVYVERELANGKIRRGLVGKVDLEEYSYAPDAQTPIRATEGTVLSRIPPRMEVRRDAAIELPHIMMLVDDPERTVIEPLTRIPGNMLYSASLMENGGRVTGWSLTAAQETQVLSALEKIADASHFETHYHAEGKAPLVFAIGDGNHSLATAKACWEEKKVNLSPEERENNPARYALVELVNLHDDSLEFEAIHRVVFGIEPERLLDALCNAYPGAHLGAGEGHQIRFIHGTDEGVVTIPHPQAQLEVGTLQKFLDTYLEVYGGKVDYIHGEDVVRKLSVKPGSIGFLLPAMEKSQLFPTVIFDSALPRKTFSMGEAHDKRFYLEARKIR
ncbi:MAG: DUF1015 domain-containing protein, partial [Evtepia sp.]